MVLTSKKIIVGFFTILLLGCSSVMAQQKAFEEIRVVFNYQQNTNQNDFHDYWSGKDAFGIDLETPFYAGDFFISGRYANFSNLSEEVPAFQNYQFNVGWGLRREIFPQMEVGASVGGIFAMYDYDGITEEQWRWAYGHLGTTSSENETGFIFSGDLSYDFFEHWGVRLSANRTIVYTNKKIKLNYVGVGIYRVFQTPNWLREFLK